MIQRIGDTFNFHSLSQKLFCLKILESNIKTATVIELFLTQVSDILVEGFLAGMYCLIETQVLTLFKDGAFEHSSFMHVVEYVNLLVVIEDLVNHAVIVGIEKVD